MITIIRCHMAKQQYKGRHVCLVDLIHILMSMLAFRGYMTRQS